MTRLNVPTARVFQPLLAPARYKGAHGGRGSGKSHFFAGLMVEAALMKPGFRGVCIREVQKSLKESAKRLIEDKIAEHQLGSQFEVQTDQIKTPGGGVLIFQGMQDHTAESVKSLEAFDVAWTEEAQSLSQRSLTLLRPTIRKDGSELWFSWNPTRKADPVDHLFRGNGAVPPGVTWTPPTGAVVVQANWQDNPWFPKELEQERLDVLRLQPDQYEHIYGGDYAKVTEGAYYAADLLKARQEGRIGRVAADPLMTFRAIWDIGGTGAKADACAIWIEQWIAREIRVLNYYEAVGQPLATHVNWLREKGYGKALCILPHDGDTNDKVHDTNFASALRAAGFEVKVIPNQGKGAAKMRIEAQRRLFPRTWFNEETTRAGLDALGAYHEKRDETRQIGLGPEHDWCLAAGTQVMTPSGWRAVETLSIHDQVLSPCGSRAILRSGIVRVTNEWTTVRGVRCTPEHRFFTSRGLVEAAALSPQDRLWTRGSLGLESLAFLCAISRSGFKVAITSVTRAASHEGAAGRRSFIEWSLRLCMAAYRKGMKSITSTITRSITTPITSPRFLAFSTAASTSPRRDTPAPAASAGKSLAATSGSDRGAVQSASEPTTRVSSANAEPAYNITVDRDECYFVRGDDGRAYLVSNSSHGADAKGLGAVAYEEPQPGRSEVNPLAALRGRGAGSWMGR